MVINVRVRVREREWERERERERTKLPKRVNDWELFSGILSWFLTVEVLRVGPEAPLDHGDDPDEKRQQDQEDGPAEEDQVVVEEELEGGGDVQPDVEQRQADVEDGEGSQ